MARGDYFYMEERGKIVFTRQRNVFSTTDRSHAKRIIFQTTVLFSRYTYVATIQCEKATTHQARWSRIHKRDLTINRESAAIGNKEDAYD